MLIPYDTCDIEREAGLRQVAELKSSGKYAKVMARNRQPENGKQFVRIFVERKPETDNRLT